MRMGKYSVQWRASRVGAGGCAENTHSPKNPQLPVEGDFIRGWTALSEFLWGRGSMRNGMVNFPTELTSG